MKKQLISLCFISVCGVLNAASFWPVGFSFNPADDSKRDSITHQLDKYKQDSGNFDEMTPEELHALLQDEKSKTQQPISKKDSGVLHQFQQFVMSLISRFYIAK